MGWWILAYFTLSTLVTILWVAVGLNTHHDDEEECD